jgi:GTP-binding protein EngB required for normal cell division
MSDDKRIDESLNEFQARRLRVTCQYIDSLLGEVEQILNVADSKAAFPRYSPDIAPIQRRTIEDYICRVRAQLVRVLEGQGLLKEKPFIPASRAVHVTLGAIDIAAEELKPRYMRGYGDLPESVATELNGIAGELQSLIHRLDSYLAHGIGEDLKARLQRLDQARNDLQLLGTIERIVRERGMVEFRSAIGAVLDRAEDNSFEIAVFGRVSSGKSSLLNTILETSVLPVGVTPITTVPTRITYADHPSLNVWFSEAPKRELGIEALAEFATEQQNPANAKRVTRIVVALPSPRLREGVAFVDTPGLGSLATSGAAETLAYLPKCDLGVVLIDAGSTLTAEDLQTILTLRAAAIPANVLVSKADLLSTDDCKRIVEYVHEHVLSECAMDLTVHPVSVLPSSRRLLDDWFQNEIVQLYDRARELRAASLRRKIGALRESVGSALQTRMNRGQQSSLTSRDQVRTAEASLRRATGQIEETRSLLERAVEGAAGTGPEAIRAAAARLIGSWSHDREPKAAGVVVRDAIAEFVRQEVGKLQTYVTTFAAQLRHDLKQCASDLGVVNVPAENEFDEILRCTPIFDPQPLDIELSPRGIGGVFGRSVSERRVAGRIQKQLGRSFQQQFESYWKLVKNWTDSVMTQLKDRFETYAETYRAQAEQALEGGNPTAEDLGRIQADLAVLGVTTSEGERTQANFA